MSVLVVREVTKYYLDKLVLDGVSFVLGVKEKVALLGSNGCGKTTLLKVIGGKLTPDEGIVILQGGARTHYLSQEPNLPPARNLEEAVTAVFASIKAIEQELRSLEAQMDDALNL